MTDKKVKIWFATQDVVAQLKDPNKIRCGYKKGTDELVTECFKDISYDDRVIFYAFECHLVLGLFRVISDKPISELDHNGHKVASYRIERLPGNKGFLDIVKLFEEGYDQFKAFPNGILKSNLKDDQFIQQISEDDYKKIEGFYRQENLLSRFDIDDKKVALLSASLDFYGNRATSFVSLFVASIFGIVTLSAIIQGLNSTSFLDIVILHFSMIPFAAFAIAGWYTLQKYFHYGDIAERIRFWGLTYPYYYNLSTVKELKYSKHDGVVVSGKIDDLVDDLLGGRQLKKGSNNFMSAFKEIIGKKNNFSVLYFIVIIILYIVVYYSALT